MRTVEECIHYNHHQGVEIRRADSSETVSQHGTKLLLGDELGNATLNVQLKQIISRATRLVTTILYFTIHQGIHSRLLMKVCPEISVFHFICGIRVRMDSKWC